MNYLRIKKVQIEPKDFSDRKYFPGTPGHPFHFIDKLQKILAQPPFPIYVLFFGGITYLLSGNGPKSLLIAGFFLLDWILLSLLPFFRLSFGPQAVTVLALGVMRSPFLFFDFPIALTFQIVGTLLVLYGFYFEPQFPRITQYEIRETHESDKAKDLCIVHLSDLHMEFFTYRENRAVRQINALSPDIILFTGDFFNLSYQEDPKSHQDIIHFFNSLKAKHGIYGVTGSPSVDLEGSLTRILPDINLILLRDQMVDINIHGESIQLIGLDCTHQPGKDFSRLLKIIKKLDSGEPKTRILLYHSPDIAPYLQNLPINLQVSGHTHGGQVQIPFLGPIYTGSLYGRAFTSGHYVVNHSHHLIISRGLGLEGEAAPRVRFFSPPEVGCISYKIPNHHVK
jgi:hypothetical protein